MSGTKVGGDREPVGFLRNTLTLVWGRVAAQAITFAGIPIITRLYHPAAFGQFSIYMAIVTIISSFATLRYILAVQLPLDTAGAASIAVLAVLIAAVISIASFVALISISWVSSFGVETAVLPYLLVAVFVSVWVGAVKASLDAYFLRQKLYKQISASYVIGAGMDRMTTIGSGFMFGSVSLGLVTGKIAGQLFLIAGMFGRGGYSIIREAFRIVSWERIIDVMRRYRGFAGYAWLGLIVQVTLQAPVFVMGWLFSSASAGLYGLAFRVLSLPMQLIGESLSRSFYQKASQNYRTGRDVGGITLELFRALVILIFVPMCVFAINAPYLFGLFFGRDWLGAGLYAGLMVPMLITDFVVRHIVMLFDLYEKQKLLARFEILLIFFVGLSLLGGAAIGNELIAIGAYSASWVIIDIAKAMTIIRYAGRKGTEILASMGRVAIICLCICGPLLAVKEFSALSPILLLFVSCVIVILYWLIAMKVDPGLRNRLLGKNAKSTETTA